MTQKMDNPISAASQWHHALLGIAIVSGIFSLIVLGMLIYNLALSYSASNQNVQLYSQPLLEKKLLLDINPADETVKSEIRQMDYEIRQDFFHRLYFSIYGKYLLLIGIAIFILSVKKLLDMQKQPPMPSFTFLAAGDEAKRLMQSRRAVMIAVILFLGGMISLGFTPKIDLASQLSNQNSAAEETYPTPDEIKQNWNQFRGPFGQGIAYIENAPEHWDAASNQNILWKSEIPLPGHNSPIVWDDKAFLSGANENEKAVFCFSLETGGLLWKTPVQYNTVQAGEELLISDDTGLAASTMACDGTRVYAIFADGDIAAIDFNGRLLWSQNFGTPQSMYGYAASLAVYQNLLLIQYDQGHVEDNLSKVYALHGKTGQVVWQKDRPVSSSWTSPILIESNQQFQFITCSEPWVIAYKPDTGDELWRANLMGSDLAPSPAFTNGMVFAVQPYETLFAIKPDGTGDVTVSHLAWKTECSAPDISSPVAFDDLVFLLSSGMLSCYNALNGELHWEHEVDGLFQSSPIVAGGWLYLMSEEGKAYRIKASNELEESTPSELNDKIKATPAFVEGKILIRGESHLYCIGSEKGLVMSDE